MCSLYVSAAISFGWGNFFLQWAMDVNCGCSLMTGESGKNNWLRLCHKISVSSPSRLRVHCRQGTGRMESPEEGRELNTMLIPDVAFARLNSQLLWSPAQDLHNVGSINILSHEEGGTHATPPIPEAFYPANDWHGWERHFFQSCSHCKGPVML